MDIFGFFLKSERLEDTFCSILTINNDGRHVWNKVVKI